MTTKNINEPTSLMITVSRFYFTYYTEVIKKRTMTSFFFITKLTKLFILDKFPFDTVKLIYLGIFMLNLIIVDANDT